MKFNANATIEIQDNELLEIVNESQDWDKLEPFDSLEEVPLELIFMVLDNIDYFETELDIYLSPTGFTITKID